MVLPPTRTSCLSTSIFSPRTRTNSVCERTAVVLAFYGAQNGILQYSYATFHAPGKVRMKKYAYLLFTFAAGSILLIGTPCVAQTTTTSGTANSANRHSSGAKAQSSQQSDIAVDHAGGNGVRRTAGGSAQTEPKSNGTNPLYESKDKAAPKPGSTSSQHRSNHASREMTTRYRPGNQKTTSAVKTKPESDSNSPQK